MAKSKKPVARSKKPAASKSAAEAKDVTSAASKAGETAASKADAAASGSAKAIKTSKDAASDATVAAKESAKPDATAKTDPKPAPETSKPASVTDSDSKGASSKGTTAESAAPAKTSSAAVPAAPLPVAVPEEKPRSIFLPLVLGGIVAGGIGFALSEYDVLGTRGADTAVDDKISGLVAMMEAQENRIEAIEEAEPATPQIDIPDLAPVTAQIEEVAAQLEGIETRLTAVEKQPMSEGTSQVAIEAYERELAALQASAAAQRAEIEGLIDNALNVKEATADAARTANVQAALTKVTAAIGTGQPFADALGELGENGVTDLPAGLSDVAESGVVTLSNLQTRFPDSARASLSAARASGAGGEEEAGLGGFLKRQLGARSVAPKEGSDPDAVLSRAEAAVRDGQLDTALTEIDGLPDAAKTAMQDWLDDARARQAAAAAAADLSNSLTAN